MCERTKGWCEGESVGGYTWEGEGPRTGVHECGKEEGVWEGDTTPTLTSAPSFQVLVVLEYMLRGDLRSFLQKIHPK